MIEKLLPQGLTRSSSDKAEENALPSFYSFRSHFGSISMHQSDMLRLIGFPDEVLTPVRNVIQQSWPYGVRSERMYGGSYEFRMHGYPWNCQGYEAVAARRLVRNLLATLCSLGWVMTFSVDLSKKMEDKDSMIFRYQSPPPPTCEWMSVSFSQWHCIRLYDAPSDLVKALAQDLAPVLRSPTAYQHSPGVAELRCIGTPWYANGRATMTSRQIALQMVMTLEQHGFSVYASIDQKLNINYSNRYNHTETDTWHVCRPVDWRPGMPVFHK
ncbi:hypothetical protein MNAN1_002664 [Malassezia nana]|uniref:Uncharacterized protein n=1 Tax=Malassezia nana TaxID=180528 RepID=A0AAF0ENE9_9BASI|nr:hypothetical protein MNAN1_002664 [Malassezia nana]